MNFDYKINPQLDIPLYTQLIDMIRSDIVTGRIEYGTKLPTVREFSDECSIARGTVMRAYSELEQQGYLEKIQGRGTFVSYRESSLSTRKDSAMAAIDAMLDTLDNLNFSRTESEIFIDLKLRERYAGRDNVSVAVVECNYETLLSMSEQLRALGGVDVFNYQLDDILAYPYKIGSDIDLVVVSASHAEELAAVLPDSKKLAKAAMHLTNDSLSALARIPQGAAVGILCRSRRFGEIIRSACMSFAPDANVSESCTTDGELSAYIAASQVLVVPGCYKRVFDASLLAVLAHFESKGDLICCDYSIDEGSMLYLADKITRIKDKK